MTGSAYRARRLVYEVVYVAGVPKPGGLFMYVPIRVEFVEVETPGQPTRLMAPSGRWP